MIATVVQKNLRILVVDDNRAVHEDFQKILCGSQDSAASLAAAEEALFDSPAELVRVPDFKLDSAFQGEEGLAKAREAAAAGQPYAMAFIDVRMPPGWDGVETTLRIWEACPDLQVVICTAYSDYSWNGMLARLGNNDQLVILKKPFDTMEVLQLANALTEKWRLTQESRLKQEQLEKLVQHRTQALRSSKENLQTEIIVRKDAETRVREQARMLDLAQDAIMVLDLDGYVRYWNMSAERLYGWPATESLGSRIADLYCGDAAALQKEHESRRHVNQGEWSGELTHVTKSGRQVLVQSRWTLVRDIQSQPKSILVINSDITEKKQLEAQFLAAQRMVSLGTLAIGIAHDLNNILAPVMMISPLLRAEISDPATLALLDAMETSAQRGADIVKQILVFSRGGKSEQKALDSFRLLKEFAGYIRGTLPSNIQLKLDVPKDLWMVQGNSTELHQVLVNLCLNAREAMPKGGSLALSAKNVTVDEKTAAGIPHAKPGPHVLWKVADTGIGIPPQNLNRVFDPFFTTKEVGQGPGLGLSSVLGIVKGMGGCIHLKSATGLGTEATILFPALGAGAAGAASQLPEPPAGPGPLILVADQDEILASMVGKILTASGYRVLISLEEADTVELYRRHWREIGVVLFDMMMPEMEQGVASLRAINPAVKLLAGGAAPTTQSSKSMPAPAEMCLRKPYETPVLLEALRKALQAA